MQIGKHYARSSFSIVAGSVTLAEMSKKRYSKEVNNKR
jgi:hypothetical protein